MDWQLINLHDGFISYGPKSLFNILLHFHEELGAVYKNVY